MDKCSTVELGVQYPSERKEKENIEHLILLKKVSKEQERYVPLKRAQKVELDFHIVITIITIHHSFATHAHLDLTY